MRLLEGVQRLVGKAVNVGFIDEPCELSEPALEGIRKRVVECIVIPSRRGSRGSPSSYNNPGGNRNTVLLPLDANRSIHAINNRLRPAV